jgi:hypothetical protein
MYLASGCGDAGNASTHAPDAGRSENAKGDGSSTRQGGDSESEDAGRAAGVVKDSGTTHPAGGSGSADAGASETELVWVSIDNSGQKSMWNGTNVLVRTVKAPGVLSVRDTVGEQHADLDAADYAAVLNIVFEPAFIEALQDPDDCHLTADGVGGDVELLLMNDGTYSSFGDRSGMSCVYGLGDAADHPYHRLNLLMIDLQKKYLP